MKRHLRLPLYILIFASLSTLSAFVTLKVLTYGESLEVPDVIGQSLTDAEAMLGRAGLNLKVESEDFDPAIPAGHVLRQDVPPGSKVKKKEIAVVVSRGPALREVPSVLGKTLDEAKRAYTEQNIKVMRVIKVHSPREKGIVVAQGPPPELWSGEPITLIVSSGPVEVAYYCPSFKGMSVDDAASLARQLGINAKFLGTVVTGDTVTGQRPEAGSELKEGSTVYLKSGG